MLVTCLWITIHAGSTWALAHGYTRWRGSSPVKDTFSAPRRMLVPAALYLLITAVLLWLIVAAIPGGLPRSPWWSDCRLGVLGLGAAAGLLPTASTWLVLNRAGRGTATPQRIRPDWLLALLLVLAINAVVEELAYRNAPLALTTNAWAAFLIPLLGFAAIHFLEADRPRGVWRSFHLVCGAMLFFVIAQRYGLAAAALCHLTVNVGAVLLTSQGYHGSQDRQEPERARYAAAGIGMLVGAAGVWCLPL